MRADPLAIRTQGTFSACGVSWDNYEPIRWNRTDGLTHFAACASASGDPSIIGVCHTGGVGHDSWQDCADVPAARCDGLVGPDQSPAKLLFVSCDGVDDPRLAVLGSTTPSPAPSPAPTTAPSREPRTFESSASSGQEALALGEGPHVTNLNGDSFDIGTPSSDYTLLRVPYDEEGPELLRLSASMDADGVRACSLYVKEVSLSGSLLAHQTVRVRPSAHTAGGSDQAGNKARANFSLRVGSSSWRDLWHDGVGAEVPEARVGLLTARLVWRKGPGQSAEAQSLELRVEVGRDERPVVLTLSQASHRALNLEVGGLGILGRRRVAGALGTEGRNASLEQPSPGCLREAAAHSAAQRRGLPDAPASYVSASWE